MIVLNRGKYKNLSLTIDIEGNVIVKAPYKMKEKEINSFIKSKENWINKHKQKFLLIHKIKEDYDFSNNIYFLNKKYQFKGNKRVRYIEIFKNWVVIFAKEISNRVKLPCNSIKLSNSKRIWGSFDRNYNMKLNLKISVLPLNLIEYIIIHELCHGLEFNHSKNFWKTVEKFCPNYKDRKNQLNQLGFILSENVFD